jgi:HEAT repeats
MSPFEHALVASGAIAPHELDEAVARQLIYGGELASSLLEVTSVAESRLAAILSEATGRPYAPPPPWRVVIDHTRKLMESGFTSVLAVARPAADPTGLSPMALFCASTMSDDHIASAKEVLGLTPRAPLEVYTALEVRIVEACMAFDLRTPEERTLRLLSRIGPADHHMRPEAGFLPEPMMPLRGEFIDSGSDLDQTAPPPMDYEDLAARAAVDATPGSRTDESTTERQKDPGAWLERAKTKDEVVVAALEILTQRFRFAAGLLVQKGEARVTLVQAQGTPPKTLQNVAVPLDMPSAFQRALEHDRVVAIRAKASGIEAGVCEDLERSPGTEVLLIPIRIKKRPVMLFWADNGRGAHVSGEVKEAELIQGLIARSVEKLLLERKRQSQFALPVQPKAPPSEPSVSTQEPFPRAITPAPGALGPDELRQRQQELHLGGAPSEDPSDKAAPEASSSEATDAAERPPSGSPAPSSLTGSGTFATGAGASGLAPLEIDEPRLSARTLISSRPYVGTQDLLPPPESRGPNSAYPNRALGEDAGAPSGVNSAVMSPSALRFNESGARSPEYLDGPAPQSLRPSQLPPPDEYEELIERLGEGDETVISRFIDGGEAAVAALMMSFPGQVIEPKNMKARPQDCGPVLKALIHIGRRSIPFLTVRTWDENPFVRRWATFALGELPSKDSGEAIARRLLDRSPEVRRAALAAARRVQGDPIARRALRSIVEQCAFDTTLHPDSRAGAVEALVDVREPASVPAMLKLLEDSDKSVRRSAKWALTVLLRQDFGTDLASWVAFWEAHRDADRVEWLILALDHPSHDLRRAAGDELSTLAGDSFGYEPQQSAADRRGAQLRFRTWWEEQGKMVLSRSNV